MRLGTFPMDQGNVAKQEASRKSHHMAKEFPKNLNLVVMARLRGCPLAYGALNTRSFME